VAHAVLVPLASLKLTVVLLSMGLFLVFAGTMALTKYDMWDVVRNYFRTPFAWIELQIFFPPAFFPSSPQVPGGFPFPGGWVLGGLMFANLLAAHTVRFTVQTRGLRLAGGIAVIALGLVVTGLVIVANEDRDGTRSQGWISYDVLWVAFKWGVVLLAVGAAAATVAAFVQADPLRRVQRWVLLPIALTLVGVAGYLLFAGDGARMSDPSMRILSQLLSAGFAGLVLLAGCILAFKKRAGIVVLHFGIGFLMFNELWVSTTHVEAQITLEEQKAGRPDRATASHVQDVRELELAIIKRGGGEDGQDQTVAIPQAMLLDSASGSEGGRYSRLAGWLFSSEDETPTYPVVQDSQLPFDVQVLTFHANAETARLPADESNDVVDAGHGRYLKLVELPPVTGVDKGENQPAAIIRFFEKGTSQPLTTHLVSVEQTMLAQWAPTNLDSLEEVRVDGNTYEVYLRYRRINKPYTVTLTDVRRDNYLGTSTPKDYSSDIHIEGASSQGETVATTAHIWMNNPLRLFGDTFYQSGFHEPSSFYGERSTLSVVTNGGWMIPYVCCMIVAVGMFYQFRVTLGRFLSRLATPPAAPVTATPVLATVADPADQRGQADTVSQGNPAGASAPRAGQGGEPSPARRGKNGQPRRRDGQPTPAAAAGRPWRRFVAMYLPVFVVVLFIGWLGSRMRPPSTPEGKLRYLEFGKNVVVVAEGRPKPVDTLARNTLRIISGSEEYVDHNVTDDSVSGFSRFMRLVTGNPNSGKPKTPAIVWLLDLMSGAPDARKQRVIRVDNREVLKVLHLKARKGYLYSHEEISANRGDFDRALDEASEEHKRNERGLSAFQRKVLKLGQQLALVEKLMLAHVVPPKRGDNPEQVVKFLVGVAELKQKDKLSTVPFLSPRDTQDEPWEPLAYGAARAQVHELARRHRATSLPALRKGLINDLVSENVERRVALYLVETLESILAKNSEKQLDPQELRRLAVEKYDNMPSAMRQKLEEGAREDILSHRSAIVAGVERQYGPLLDQTLEVLVGKEKLGEPNAVAVTLTAMMNAAHDGDANAFNEALEKYPEAMAAAAPRDYRPGRARFEASFNSAAPFYYASVLNLIAFLFVLLSWLFALVGWRKPLNRTSFWLIVLALVIHTFALVSRLYISGRPPVTNLYSSAVFIGWGAVVFGMVIEIYTRLGIGNALASVAGFSTLLIAHYLAGDGDTFTVLQAVLDTQFWLATHVVCITLGYTAMFVAGLLGITYVLGGTLSPALGMRMGQVGGQSITLSQQLGKLIYGVLCFALFLSFVGTVLGGLWADDSWGRFWGWDPKENGALMIVIWSAIVLHARWGGMVKDRGLAVLAIGGNIVTSWSWFAVNELGIGLHSYGFTEGVMLTLVIVWLVHVVLLIVGSLPKSWWWSFSGRGDGAGQGSAA
jgi:ABC-type transport system involved in cytochrome c biogenesis permease subunit